MKTIKIYKLIVITGLILLVSCNKSDENPERQRTEINNDSVIGADVDAPEFWGDSKLVWSEEFNVNSLSTDNWEKQVYKGGQGNTELQDYTRDDNIELSDGTLKIIVKKTGPGQQTGDYTSARLHSKFAFTYGKIEMRAKLPPNLGNGLWVKLWMLGNNFEIVGFPECGVIDIMKYVSHKPAEFLASAISAETAQIGSPTTSSNPIPLINTSDGFHIYGLLWTDKYLKFYLNDVDNIVFTYRKPLDTTLEDWAFSKPFYFIMNIAVGGEFGGVEGVDDTIFPTAMEIDYIRVYHAN